VKLFSQRGLDGTSIRDIAEESGYTNPALYKHFAGKEELALYLFEICHRRLWTKCHTAIVAAKTFEAKLEGYTSDRSSNCGRGSRSDGVPVGQRARPVAKSRTDGPPENHDRPGSVAHERRPPTARGQGSSST
jgi:AcrR family transcriptional regulator